MSTENRWLWPVPDYTAAEGSPGRRPDADRDRERKARLRKMSRPRGHHSQRPAPPRAGLLATGLPGAVSTASGHAGAVT